MKTVWNHERVALDQRHGAESEKAPELGSAARFGYNVHHGNGSRRRSKQLHQVVPWRDRNGRFPGLGNECALGTYHPIGTAGGEETGKRNLGATHGAFGNNLSAAHGVYQPNVCTVTDGRSDVF